MWERKEHELGAKSCEKNLVSENYLSNTNDRTYQSQNIPYPPLFFLLAIHIFAPWFTVYWPFVSHLVHVITQFNKLFRMSSYMELLVHG